MLDPRAVAEVKRLLAAGGKSQAAIARATGVSSSSVSDINTGKRRDRPKHDESNETPGPTKRCPTCGCRVVMPCVYCRAKKALREAELPFTREDNEADADLSLNLRGGCRKRLDDLRRRREGDQAVGSWQEPVAEELGSGD